MIASIASKIADLRAGERAWFWFTDHDSTTEPVFMLEKLSSDPKMESLRQNVQISPSYQKSVSYFGVGHLNADGALTLGASGLKAEHLVSLAKWVRANVNAHPELARLKNLTLTNVDPKGVVKGVHSDPSLWEGVPEPPDCTTISRAFANLAKLSPKVPVWFWATDAWLGAKPHLILKPMKKDPKAEKFALQMRANVKLCSDGAKQTIGTVTRMPDKSYVWATSGSVSETGEILGALIQHHGSNFGYAVNAHVVALNGGKISDALSVKSLFAGEWGEQDRLLKELQAGQKLYFWWHRSGTGSPDFVLGPDQDAVKRRVKKIGPQPDSVQGTLEISEKGWFHFSSRKDNPDFLPALAEWAVPLFKTHPGVRRLANARLTCTSKSGEMLGRYRSSQLWTVE